MMTTVRDIFCGDCEADRRHVLRHRDEALDIRGETITLAVPSWVCSTCGESIVDGSFGDPVGRYYDVYRERHGLLLPDDIKAIRERWAMSQESFAKLLGMSQATISRYEQGSLQETTHDELMRACEDRSKVIDLLQRNGAALAPLQRLAVEKALEHPSRGGWFVRLMADPLLLSEQRESSIWTGFRGFDRHRFGGGVAWLVKRVEFVSETKLYKLLFYVDFLHFRRTARSLTGLTYAKLPFGPVPERRELLMDWLERTAIVTTEEESYSNGRVGLRIRPGPAADEFGARLEADEVATLDVVATKLGALSPSAMSERSHEEPAWRETDATKPISYALSAGVALGEVEK